MSLTVVRVQALRTSTNERVCKDSRAGDWDAMYETASKALVPLPEHHRAAIQTALRGWLDSQAFADSVTHAIQVPVIRHSQHGDRIRSEDTVAASVPSTQRNALGLLMMERRFCDVEALYLVRVTDTLFVPLFVVKHWWRPAQEGDLEHRRRTATPAVFVTNTDTPIVERDPRPSHLLAQPWSALTELCFRYHYCQRVCFHCRNNTPPTPCAHFARHPRCCTRRVCTAHAQMDCATCAAPCAAHGKRDCSARTCARATWTRVFWHDVQGNQRFVIHPRSGGFIREN
jgi:hypothetical protein